MTRRRSRLTGLLLTLLLLAGCAAPPDRPGQPDTLEARQAEFQAFLSQANLRHKASCGLPFAIYFPGSWTPDLDRLTGQLTGEEMLSLVRVPYDRPEAVTAREAEEDIEAAFLLLKHAYAAYDYFGGDAVFLPIRDAALADLPEEGDVTRQMLEDILAARLAPVVIDGHFRVGSTRLWNSHASYTYYVLGLFFDDTEGLPPELVKPTIDSEGRIRFCLAAAATPEEAEALPASLEIKGETVALNWTRDEPLEPDRTDVFTEGALADGTPLLTAVRMAWRTEEQRAQIERLASCGEEYADAPLLVWDLRGNNGGNSEPFYNWFQGYPGQPPAVRRTIAAKFSELNIFAASHQEREPDFLPEKVCWAWRHDAGRWLESDNLVLALQDKGTASAPELGITELYTRENTLCIGSSTYGALMTAYNYFFYLPNSGLSLYLGTYMMMRMDRTSRECTGLAPDLWVPSGDALDAAEWLIAYYGLAAEG